MISIGDTIISDDLLAEEFVCNISKCKGECCVSGEAGAPLEKNEIKYLKKNFKKIKPFLSKKGIKAIEKQGVFVKGYNDELETPLIKGKECAFTVFSKDGIASCGIEKAYNKGVINFQKPISCHLYPVRINEYDQITAINYQSWSICSDACKLGKSLKIPVYKFVKKALIRKFGISWFNSLERISKNTF